MYSLGHLMEKLTPSDAPWQARQTAFLRKNFSGPGKSSHKSSRDRVIIIVSVMFAAMKNWKTNIARWNDALEITQDMTHTSHGHGHAYVCAHEQEEQQVKDPTVKKKNLLII